MATSLEPLFRPHSIAIIGASRDERSISGTLARNLINSFRGPLYLVNPHTDRIGKLPSYPSILNILGAVDLAFIAVPVQHVLAAVRDCVAKPVRAIVVISAGFAEIGAADESHEAEILALAREADIPLIGPNCLGILSNDPDAPLNGTFGPGISFPGHVAIATQSGALGFVLPELLRSRNLGVWSLVSLGNKLDLGENDFLRYWLNEPAARTILLYLESFQNPRELIDLGRQHSQERPVIVLKAGRTSAGTRAAGSHTAALATPDRLADGLCKQAGLLRVDTLQEMLDVASLVTTQRWPNGTRVAVVSNAGGLGVLCTDVLVTEHCEVPELSAALQARLRSFVPPHATVHNPIDLVASIEPQLVARCVKCLLASDEVDAILLLYVPRIAGTSLDIANAVQQVNRAAGSRKILLTAFVESEKNIVHVQQALEGVPCFAYPESAARTLARAVQYAARQMIPAMPDVPLDATAATNARKIVNHFLAESDASGGWLETTATHQLLGYFHLHLPAWQTAGSQEEAMEAGEKVGFPVVIKAIAPALLHKSAAGGVVLDVRNTSEARSAWHKLATRIAGLSGVLVQRFVPGGEEAIIGVKRQAGFGHVIGLGAGGAHAEKLQQMEFRLLPLTSRDAYALIRDSAVADGSLTTSGRLTATGSAVYEVLLRLSALVSAIPEITELDLNPVVLLPTPPLICVLDARIHMVRESGSHTS